jgi:hypothetical protein
LPHSQSGLVETSTHVENPEIYTDRGEIIPCETFTSEEGDRRLRFLAGLKGFGYSVIWIRKSHRVEPAPHKAEGPIKFENPSYRAVVGSDGSFASLVLKSDGRELIDTARGSGNSLSATDSSSISFEAQTPEQRIEQYLADPPVRGAELVWIPSGSASVKDTPLGRTFTVSGNLGQRAQAELTIHFYHQLDRIDLTWDFQFEKASIGTFFDDDSKLLVRWPLAIEGQIYHDIPFGIVQESEDRPFFPISWVDLSDGTTGLAYFHRGTPNHWVNDGVLYNLIGWGEQTDAIHNGLGRYQWLKSFDQRLDGRHTIHLAVYPHMGDWRTAGIPRAAREYGSPLLAYPALHQNGGLPSSRILIELADPSLSTTTVFTGDGKIICRVYAPDGEEASPLKTTGELKVADLRLLDGTQVENLQPYQVGELILAPDI